MCYEMRVAAPLPGQRAHGVVVSHPLRMRKALGSNPSVSIVMLDVTVPPLLLLPESLILVATAFY